MREELVEDFGEGVDAFGADEEAKKGGSERDGGIEVLRRLATAERRDEVEKIVKEASDEDSKNSDDCDKKRENRFLIRMELFNEGWGESLSSMRETKIGFVFRTVEKIVSLTKQRLHSQKIFSDSSIDS